jgi:peptidoglycan/xylan/chitin deacetylase (PgdA/CDA1 family)
MNILMLHDVREFNNHFFPERYKLPYFLKPDQFDCLIKNLINSNSKVLSLRETIIINEETIDQNIQFLTFDDGLKDHLQIAHTLHSQNIRASFFIPSGPILENSIIDSHKIQFILASTHPNNIVLFIRKSYKEYFNKPESDLDVFFISKWINNIWSKEMVFVTRVLREFPDSIWKRKMIDQLFCKYVTSDTKSFSSDFYLNIEDIFEILSLGHYIGGHGHYSYDLRFEDHKTIVKEIDEMDNFISQFNQDKKLYAYANGGFNDFVIEQILFRNYDYAFATGHRKVEKTDPHWVIPRIDATKTKLINA